MSNEPWLPVHPDLAKLKREASDILSTMRGSNATIEDAQQAVAIKYGAPTWKRLVQACALIDAIWDDDIDKIRKMVTEFPYLLHENAGIRNENWGPPLSYAANVGRDRIIEVLFELGAKDLEKALDRAVLQGRIETAKLIHKLLGSPKPPPGAFGSPAYTLKVKATEYLFEIGGELIDADGKPDAPADIVLESDSRNPEAKHKILELYVQHGFELPDTPMMALHRGRLDLLEAHMKRDPNLLQRTFTWPEIYPPGLKCQQLKPGSYHEMLPRTPINGSTLLHVCVEYDELDIARWLLEKGMDPNVRARVDENGFGGHTALFGAAVSYPNFWMNFTGGWPGTRKPQQADFARLLLDAGADPNARASFREPIDSAIPDDFRDHHDITPLAWGKAFQY
ncbi:MAG TPA: ankyrin repeat domain-containing protein, partial [Gemmatimonadaceae bacterium]|nr:ankyrin repeat domain-containing protein [Gemmatimonadaceae bacterium]